ncbi:MAG: lipoyl(octanoyl) transferase LipB [Deltaproteobacteria bacterium]|nr:lipoyl(octanoyl) transferase LipB [Deltaproteobacteria bacterium]
MKPRLLDLCVLDGLTPYDEGHALQLELVERRKSGAIPDTLILVEHEPVITLGRNASDEGLLATADELTRAGVILRRIERGGQATYHGPGQLVGYPIFDLHALELGVATYVRNLEQVMSHAAAAFGVDASSRDKLTGVFTDQGKVGAIGVRVTRGVTFHGFALNVDPRIEHYGLIVPCGMTGTPVTSLAACCRANDDRATLRSLGETGPSMGEVREAVIAAFRVVFGYSAG